MDKFVNRGNESKLNEIPHTPLPEISPPGTIRTPQDRDENSVAAEDVEKMRIWNMEHKLGE